MWKRVAEASSSESLTLDTSGNQSGSSSSSRKKSKCVVTEMFAGKKRIKRKRSHANVEKYQTGSESDSSIPSPEHFDSFKDDQGQRKMHVYDFSQIICMYLVRDEYYHDYPSYVRFAKGKDKEKECILGVDCSFLGPREFELLKLDDEQRNRWECFSECAGIMFRNLQGTSIDPWTFHWLSTTGSDDVLEKQQECQVVEKRYGLSTTISTYLKYVLLGFYGGLYNSDGRKAVECLFHCCQYLVNPDAFNKDPLKNIKNMGGANPRADGVTTCLDVYVARLEMAKAGMQKVTGSIEKKICVPDVILYKTYNHRSREGIKYLYAKCKSETGNQGSLIYELWHQALGGLISSDAVYGMGIDLRNIVLCKLFIKDSILQTSEVSLSLFDEETRGFDVSNFSKAVKFISAIINYNDDDEVVVMNDSKAT